MQVGEEPKWLLCGGVAGVFSKVIMLPMDIVKKRLEVRYMRLTNARFCLLGFFRGGVNKLNFLVVWPLCPLVVVCPLPCFRQGIDVLLVSVIIPPLIVLFGGQQ